METRRSLRRCLVLGDLLLLFLGGLLLFVELPGRSGSREVARYDGILDRGGLAGEAAPEPPRERRVGVGNLGGAELARLLLVPDAAALRTLVRPLGPDRVLEPGAIRFEALSEARWGRPFSFAFRVRGGREGDVFTLQAPGDPGKELEPRISAEGAGLESTLAPLDSRLLRVGLRWAGERKGRRGEVESWFRIRVGPPPGFWSPLPPGNPWLEALKLQGFRRAARLEEGELLVLDLSEPPPGGIEKHLDRGAGLLLLAGPSPSMHEGWIPIAPVLPLPLEPLPSTGGGEDPPFPPKGGGGTGTGGRPGLLPGRKGAVQAPAEPRVVGPGGPERQESVALILLLDDSGSMSFPRGRPRIEMARRGALHVAEVLGEEDELALISFGERTRVLLPLAARPRKSKLEKILASLKALGRATEGLPGLRTAWRELKKSEADLRHIVLLTDGQFTDLTTGRSDYEKISRQMKAEGIGLTGLGILGEGGDEALFGFLRKLSEDFGGGFTLAGSSAEIPGLLVRQAETVVARARPGLLRAGPPSPHGGPGKPERGKEALPRLAREFPLIPIEVLPLLEGLAEVDWPGVRSFLPLEARLRARVHLAVGRQGYAFLSTSPFGLGRVAVCAGTLTGSRALFSRPWFPRLAAQCAAWLLPPLGRDRILQMAVERGEETILQGDGPGAGTVRRAVHLLGGELVRGDGAPPGRVRLRAPPDPLVWLLLLLGAFLLLRILEAWTRS